MKNIIVSKAKAIKNYPLLNNLIKMILKYKKGIAFYFSTLYINTCPSEQATNYLKENKKSV